MLKQCYVIEAMRKIIHSQPFQDLCSKGRRRITCIIPMDYISKQITLQLQIEASVIHVTRNQPRKG
jgi:hypothetical protein